MNIFELKLWDDEGKMCTFYTVQWSDASKNETDIFFETYENDAELESSMLLLLDFVVNTIGNRHGATEALFNRFEHEVVGLPVKGGVKVEKLYYNFPRFPLRLYALKITEEIVVLFGGGLKDGVTNQESSLNLKWREACLFAKKILEAISLGEILIDETNRCLTNEFGTNEMEL